MKKPIAAVYLTRVNRERFPHGGFHIFHHCFKPYNFAGHPFEICVPILCSQFRAKPCLLRDAIHLGEVSLIHMMAEISKGTRSNTNRKQGFCCIAPQP